MTTLRIDDPAYFDCLARAENEHWWHAAMWRIASGWLDVALRGRSNLIALDIGCGSGGTLRHLLARPEIARVVGVDPSASAIALSSRFGALLGSALDLPFAKASIGVATCFDILQHLRVGDDLVAMRELRRVLRPGGVAVVRSNGKGLWPDPSLDDQPYRLEALVDVARSAGLIVRKCSYANAAPALATEILGRIASLFKVARSRSSGLGVHGHPQGRGLRLREGNPFLGWLMSAVSTAEAVAVARWNVQLSLGHSTIMLVEAPGGWTP